jgi:hypothetical protein
MTKVYIIGRVTGLPRNEVVSKFEKGEQMVKSMNLHPVNPINLVPEDAHWADAMRICIKALIDCDAVLLLPDHENSRGSAMELMIAKNTGMNIWNARFKMSEL